MLLLGFVGLVPVLLSWYSLSNQDTEGLDQASHIMDGLFFRDLIVDFPIGHLKEYAVHYYGQYPALGFKFWPPFFPLIEGIFFSMFGTQIVVARWCLLTFGVALAVLVYLVVGDLLGRLVAALATTIIMTTPLVVEHLNTIMLEVPTLAMAFLTILLYQRVVRRGSWKNWLEVTGFALVCSIAVYTKQPIIFIFPVLIIDLLVNHSNLARSRSTWVAVVLIIVLCVPLLVFTLYFSPENLAQSFGNAGDVYVKAHKVAQRWSVLGWTYYLQQVGQQCQPILAIFAVAALGYCLWSREFATRNTIWAAWIICWYLLFSYFDNKQPRFVTFVVPGVIILGCSFAWTLLQRHPAWRRILVIGLAVIVMVQLASVVRYGLSRGFSGMDVIIDELFRTEKANIAYLGDYRQLFVPYVRLRDPERLVYVLRLECFLNSKTSLNAKDVAYWHRIKWVLVEPTSDDLSKLSPNILDEFSNVAFELRSAKEFGDHRKRIKLLAYRYRGSWADKMQPIPFGCNSNPAIVPRP